MPINDPKSQQVISQPKVDDKNLKAPLLDKKLKTPILLEPVPDLAFATSLNAEQTRKKQYEKDLWREATKQEAWSKSAASWDKADRLAKDLMNKGLESFVEWATGTLETFKVIRALNKAIVKTTTIYHPVAFAIDWVIDHSKSGVMKVLDKDHLNLYTPVPEQVVTYAVDIDEEGRISADFRQDGQPLTPHQEQALGDVTRTVIAGWLRERGYQISGGKVTHRETKELLTREKLQEMNQDDASGLTSFMRKVLRVNIEEDAELARQSSFSPGPTGAPAA